MERSYKSYLLIIAVFLMISVVLVGCTSTAKTSTTASGAATSTTAPGNTGSKNEIIIESNAFKPDSLTIKIGDTVTWTNKDSYSHTVKGKNGEFDSGDMPSGAKFSFTFAKEGTIDYICGIHTFMTGKIIVTK
jgi:plastocyanin